MDTTKTDSQFLEFLKQLIIVPNLFNTQYLPIADFAATFLPNLENNSWHNFKNTYFKLGFY